MDSLNTCRQCDVLLHDSGEKDCPLCPFSFCAVCVSAHRCPWPSCLLRGSSLRRAKANMCTDPAANQFPISHGVCNTCSEEIIQCNEEQLYAVCRRCNASLHDQCCFDCPFPGCQCVQWCKPCYDTKDACPWVPEDSGSESEIPSDTDEDFGETSSVDDEAMRLRKQEMVKMNAEDEDVGGPEWKYLLKKRRMMKKIWECTVCKEFKGKYEYFHNTRKNHSRDKILRCITCHTCSTCRKIKRSDDFAHQERLCLQCFRNRETYTCSACTKKRRAIHYDSEQIRKHVHKQKSPLICTYCEEKGIIPRDLSLYTCEGLCSKQFGASGFDPKNLHNHKQRGDKLLCLICRAVEIRQGAKRKMKNIVHMRKKPASKRSLHKRPARR